MSIYDQIAYWVADRRLVELTPAFGPPTLRRIVASADVNALLIGPWGDVEWERRCGALQADLDAFMEGRLITVARQPYKGKTSYMLRLAPTYEEVWEIRSRDPNPGIRIFGSFAETDLFVALGWSKRADLKGPTSREWRDARIQCKTDWANLFRPYQPKSGANLHDYISNNAIFV